MQRKNDAPVVPTRAACWPCRLAVPHVEDVARNLRPAPHIQTLVDKVVSKLSADGPFNGVHLRLEDDARYQDLMGGQEVRLWTIAAFQTIPPVFNPSASDRPCRWQIPAPH